MSDSNTDDKKAITFSMKLSSEIHHRFRQKARLQGVSQNDYLKALMDFEEQNHIAIETLSESDQQLLKNISFHISHIKNTFFEIVRNRSSIEEDYKNRIENAWEHNLSLQKELIEIQTKADIEFKQAKQNQQETVQNNQKVEFQLDAAINLIKMLNAANKNENYLEDELNQLKSLKNDLADRLDKTERKYTAIISEVMDLVKLQKDYLPSIISSEIHNKIQN